MQNLTYQDLLSGLVTVILLVAIVSLAAFERSVPEFLTGAFGLAMGYTFRGSVKVANGVLENRTSMPAPASTQPPGEGGL